MPTKPVPGRMAAFGHGLAIVNWIAESELVRGEDGIFRVFYFAASPEGVLVFSNAFSTRQINRFATEPISSLPL